MQGNEHSFLREDAARTERWAHLTEGVEDYQKSVVETLMDNTASMIRGQLPGAQFEETSSSAIATFNRVAYPMIRRIYPELVANDLVSIQPMTLPVTLVFFLDFLYGTTQSPTVKGDRTDYEAGKFNQFYSAGVIRDEGLGTATTSQTAFSLDYYPVRDGSETVYKNSVALTTGYTINYATGAITLGAGATAGDIYTADYALVQEGLGSAGNSNIPEIELGMSSAQVGTVGRKLKARWTLETQQDLQAYHGKSAEKLLVGHMADEIKREIDREIITDILTNATAGNVNWSKAVPGGTKKGDHYETLLHAMTDVSNEAYKKRFRHSSWAVMSPDTLNMLNKINAFRALGFGKDGATSSASVVSGPAVVGTLSEVMKVIIDPLFDNTKVLLGYKGDSFDETGYVYAPYTAFQTDTFMDPNHMKPVKGLMTRYGRHVVNGDFYGTVTIGA